MAEATRDLSLLRTFSLVMLIEVALQLLLGMLVVRHVGGDGLQSAHGGIGYLLLVTSLIAAFFAFRYGRSAGAMGTFGHALSIPLLCIVQVGLAEGGQKWIHVVVGILTVLAVGSLWTLLRRPGRTAPTP